MTTLFLLIRKEKHVDDSYKLFDSFRVVKRIAQEITAYWVEQYGLNNSHIDDHLYEGSLYSAIEKEQNSFSVNILAIDKTVNS